MSFNVSEQRLEKRLINEIQNLKRMVEEMRQSQPVGADIVQTVTSPLLETGTVTLGAGSLVTFNLTVVPTDEVLTLWNIFSTLLVNNTGNTLTPMWPNDTINSGETIGSIIDWQIEPDWARSHDAIGKRVYWIKIKNNHSGSIDFNLQSKAYGIKMTYGE